MARGWESKAVEAQMEDATAGRDSASKQPLTPAQVNKIREKEGLLRARARVLDQLRGELNPRHRQMLTQALAELEQRLSELDAATNL